MRILVRTARRFRLLRVALICATLQFCAAFPSGAQFATSPNDPSSLRWMSIKSKHFEVIYPRNCDSLALSYMKELEFQRMRVAVRLGLATNGKFITDSTGGRHFVDARVRPLPVVLHTRDANSNGVVTWAPRRMELYTLPEWKEPSAMPWTTSLSIHEGRHAAQMQNGYRHVFKPFYWFLGEMVPGAAAAWPGHAGLEGDAVVAETALTNAGRGREPDFLMQYFYSYEHGDPRSRMRWRLGSYYHITPNHYSWGYFMLSGIMVGYNDPLYAARYMDYVSRRPYDPWPMRHNLRRVSGTKFGESYKKIWATHYDAWLHNVASREPFTMPFEPIVRPVRRQTVYENPNPTPDGAYLWVKSDLYHQPAVYRVDSTGREKRLWAINPVTGKMNYEERDGGHLLWNEVRPDPRWGARSHSVVMEYDFATGKRTRRSKYGIYLYPVEISRDTIVAIHYMYEGVEHIDLLDGKTKKPIAHWPVPSDKQVIEINHLDRDIYVVAVCDKGFGLWRVKGRQWTEILPPLPVRIAALEHDGPYLTFESERDGVREMYRVDPRTCRVWQLTSSRYGGTAFSLCENGDIIFSQTGLNGDVPMRVKAEDVLNKPVKWDEYYKFPIAETLSSQAEELQKQPLKSRYYYPRRKEMENADTVALRDSVSVEPDTLTISEPKRYRKFFHALHFHSWAPAYIDIDAIRDISCENVKHIAKLGLMGFYQNAMSTVYGYVGYKAAPIGGKWYHSGHFNFTYSGLYPVFELKFDVGEGEAVNFAEKTSADRNTVVRYSRNEPFINTDFRTYIPWKWSNGIYSIGLIPQVDINYNNDTYGGQALVNVSPALRAYVMQPTPDACIYPRWGIGAEMKWMQPCISATWIQPKAYAYLYGYVPGIGWGQGLKITGLYQHDFNDGRAAFHINGANLMPRGLTSVGGPFRGGRMTLDYAAPFPMGDWNISEVFYCKRGIITPHFDYSYCRLIRDEMELNLDGLWSLGATFEMEFGSFLWIRVPITLGVTYSYNDGPGYRTLAEAYPVSHHYVGATFNMELPL